MKLVTTSDWIDKKMNQGSQHKIEEVNKSYTLAKAASYRVRNLYMVKVGDKKKYMYEIECKDSESYKLVAFFKWMLYIIRTEGDQLVHLYFDYDVPETFKVNRCGMSLVDCQQLSEDTFLLKLYGDKLFESSDEELEEIDESEITEDEKEQEVRVKDRVTGFCRSLIMVVERQNEIIDELLSVKRELDNLKAHATNMTPVKENK